MSYEKIAEELEQAENRLEECERGVRHAEETLEVARAEGDEWEVEEEEEELEEAMDAHRIAKEKYAEAKAMWDVANNVTDAQKERRKQQAVSTAQNSVAVDALETELLRLNQQKDSLESRIERLAQQIKEERTGERHKRLIEATDGWDMFIDSADCFVVIQRAANYRNTYIHVCTFTPLQEAHLRSFLSKCLEMSDDIVDELLEYAEMHKGGAHQVVDTEESEDEIEIVPETPVPEPSPPAPPTNSPVPKKVGAVKKDYYEHAVVRTLKLRDQGMTQKEIQIQLAKEGIEYSTGWIYQRLKEAQEGTLKVAA